MKGAFALIVAALLGVLGVAMNYVYLVNKAAQLDSVSFLGVSEGRKIEIGNTFQANDFIEVKIPKTNARGLEHFIYLFKDRELMVGTRATRAYENGDVVWIADYRTPPTELKLDRSKKEMCLWVGVDGTSFVSDRIDPGDRILFLVPKIHGPTPAARGADGDEPALPIATNMKPDESESIGPFTVVSVGSRLSSINVARANQNASGNNSVIGIIAQNVGTEDEPKLDPKAARINGILAANPSVKARVVLVRKN